MGSTDGNSLFQTILAKYGNNFCLVQLKCFFLFNIFYLTSTTFQKWFFSLSSDGHPVKNELFAFSLSDM